MIPVPIIIGGLMAGALWLLSEEETEEETEFNGKKICPDYQKFFDNNASKKKIKSHTTKTINKLIKKSLEFKIGKSGDLTKRSGGKDYKDYTWLYPIVESTNKELIIELESTYNIKFKEHVKNNNIKGGSAGVMTDKNGKYVLYVAVE